MDGQHSGIRARGSSATTGEIPSVHVSRTEDVPDVLDRLALRRGRPVLVLVGGGRHGRRPPRHAAHRPPAVSAPGAGPARCGGRRRRHGLRRDAGDRSGAPRRTGEVSPGRGGRRGDSHRAREGPAGPDAAVLEPHHTQFVLVPGTDWGDESPWLADVADALARGAPSLTLVVNGGVITYDDATASLARGRPVLVLAGTGRTADAIAHARTGSDGDPRAMAIASSPHTSVVAVDDSDGFRNALEAALARS